MRYRRRTLSDRRRLALAACVCAIVAGSHGRPSRGAEPIEPAPRSSTASHEGAGAALMPAGSESASDGGVNATQYLEEALVHEDPAQIARLEALVDAAVAERLAGISRPHYVPATDLAPPKGLVLIKNDPRRGEFPISLALSGYLQPRWFEFARDARQWTDNAGRIRDINNINTFNINRFLLSFNGHVVDERLLYNFALFGTTNAGIRSGVVAIGQAGWRFDDAATFGVGMTIVPASREWVETTPWTVGVDRSMANTFFRPGFSPGAQFLGNLADGTVHYRAGAWNAIDGGSSGVLRRGTSMAWVGNTWWEPLGPFGLGASDMEVHASPVVRFGMSGTYAPTYALPFPGSNPEDTIVRLSDGTPLAEVGALGPDTQINRFLYQLATVDAAWKWRGVGVFCEYYWRQLSNFRGFGQFERTSMLDQGGLGYLSWCFVPRTYEAYARSSVITGPYGTGQEYGGGLNWYIRRTRQARLTLEALYMNRNPAQNLLYPYRAGYTGTAIQTQLLVIF
jgi:hypothetical protein